jgi:hypothetical protein
MAYVSGRVEDVICFGANKYAKIPEAAVKNTTHDSENRLEVVEGGDELCSALGPPCLTSLGEALSEKEPTVID